MFIDDVMRPGEGRQPCEVQLVAKQSGSPSGKDQRFRRLNGNRQRRVPDAAVRTLGVMRCDVKIDTRKQQGFERGVKG